MTDRPEVPGDGQVKCRCRCHRNKSVKHAVACCNGGWKPRPTIKHLREQAEQSDDSGSEG